MLGRKPRICEADLVAVLASSDVGLTSLEVAARLSTDVLMAGRLSKLADAGKIRREWVSFPRVCPSGRTQYCIWHSLLPPSTVTSSGPGETGPVEQGNRLDRAPSSRVGGA